MNAPLAPWIKTFTDVVATERQAMRMRKAREETRAIQRGKKLEQARMAAYEGYQRYEPESGAPND